MHEQRRRLEEWEDTQTVWSIGKVQVSFNKLSRAACFQTIDFEKLTMRCWHGDARGHFHKATHIDMKFQIDGRRSHSRAWCVKNATSLASRLVYSAEPGARETLQVFIHTNLPNFMSAANLLQPLDPQTASFSPPHILVTACTPLPKHSLSFFFFLFLCLSLFLVTPILHPPWYRINYTSLKLTLPSQMLALRLKWALCGKGSELKRRGNINLKRPEEPSPSADGKKESVKESVTQLLFSQVW